mmetsp:Transcript_12127/g.26193  ORF Transcript_12127/g.26193 Transcript_12127/m.26193 type:complete len:235 (-) Transcript_12127:700-1404(-)
MPHVSCPGTELRCCPSLRRGRGRREMRVTQLRLHRSPLRGSPSVALATRRRAAAGARTAGWWAPARRERCTAQTATRARAAARAHRTARRRPAAPRSAAPALRAPPRRAAATGGGSARQAPPDRRRSHEQAAASPAQPRRRSLPRRRLQRSRAAPIQARRPSRWALPRAAAAACTRSQTARATAAPPRIAPSHPTPQSGRTGSSPRSRCTRACSNRAGRVGTATRLVHQVAARG